MELAVSSLLRLRVLFAPDCNLAPCPLELPVKLPTGLLCIVKHTMVVQTHGIHVHLRLALQGEQLIAIISLLLVSLVIG